MSNKQSRTRRRWPLVVLGSVLVVLLDMVGSMQWVGGLFLYLPYRRRKSAEAKSK